MSGADSNEAEIKRHYSSLSDERIAELVADGADAFTAVGWRLLTQEAQKRGLLTDDTVRSGVVGSRRSLYDILGIGRAADAAEIKAAYRRQAKEWHPDKRAGSKEAEEEFKLIAAAYEVLRDPPRRARYDATLLQGLGFDLEQYVVDFQRANDLFVREMKQTAAELAARRQHWTDIAEALKEQDCPTLLATKVAKDAWADWCSGLGTRVRRRSGAAALMILGTIVAWNITEAIPQSVIAVRVTLNLAGFAVILVALWILFVNNVRDFISTRK